MPLWDDTLSPRTRIDEVSDLQQDPGLAVRAGRQLRAYHYKNLGLEVPEHGKGHFHHPRRNYNASKEAKKAAKLGGVPGMSSPFSPTGVQIVLDFRLIVYSASWSGGVMLFFAERGGGVS